MSVTEAKFKTPLDSSLSSRTCSACRHGIRRDSLGRELHNCDDAMKGTPVELWSGPPYSRQGVGHEALDKAGGKKCTWSVADVQQQTSRSHFRNGDGEIRTWDISQWRQLCFFSQGLSLTEPRNTPKRPITCTARTPRLHWQRMERDRSQSLMLQPGVSCEEQLLLQFRSCALLFHMVKPLATSQSIPMQRSDSTSQIGHWFLHNQDGNFPIRLTHCLGSNSSSY